MSDVGNQNDYPVEWRDCPYCQKRLWSAQKAFFEHLEDCLKRPSIKKGSGRCPKCGSLIVKTAMKNDGPVYVCINSDCDYALEVIDGGKHD